MTTRKQKTVTYTIVIAPNRRRKGWYTVRIPAMERDFKPGNARNIQRAKSLARTFVRARIAISQWDGKQPPKDCLPTHNSLRHKTAIVTRVRVRIKKQRPPLGYIPKGRLTWHDVW